MAVVITPKIIYYEMETLQPYKWCLFCFHFLLHLDFQYDGCCQALLNPLSNKVVSKIISLFIAYLLLLILHSLGNFCLKPRITRYLDMFNQFHFAVLYISFRVDTFIPGLDVISGFSICSSPKHFTDTGEIELAIQLSDYPPAYWVHSKVGTGSSCTFFTKLYNSIFLI